MLSTGMLLAWHGQRCGKASFLAAARAIERGAAAAIASGDIRTDACGKLGTSDIGTAFAKGLLAG